MGSDVGTTVQEGGDSALVGAAPAPSLDSWTQLDRGCWAVVYFPECGEGTAYPIQPPGLTQEEDPDAPPAGGMSAWGQLPQEERDRLNRERAVGRAKGQVRRYCVANGLIFLWSLTFAPENLPASRDEAEAEGERFIRRLRRQLGHNLPYVMVPEEGSETGRLHLHLALGEYVPVELMESVWGLGWVFVTPPRSGERAAQRVAAYVAKYVGKDIEATGRQGYRVAEGYQPRMEVALVDSLGAALALVSRAAGCELRVVALHDEVENWPGRPVWKLRAAPP